MTTALNMLTKLRDELRVQARESHLNQNQIRANLGPDLQEQFSQREVAWINSLLEETYITATMEAYERAVIYCSSHSGFQF